ncbi:hypothetical protein [Algihabitans albus]|uniref:hypothetical protein n=1 Tax=Algihabitans albus TaxID=2164067 RepID=UPI0013C37769|nr:hypothetical protein [Algihabitans albus]
MTAAVRPICWKISTPNRCYCAYESNALRQVMEKRNACICIKPAPGRLGPPAFCPFL